MKNFIFLYPVLILIHRPISIFTGIDESCILLYLADVLIFCHLYVKDNLFRTIVKDKIPVLWILLIVYHTINSFAHSVPYEGGSVMLFMNMFDAYFLMLLCAYCFIVNEHKYLRYMLYGFSVFLFITLFITKMGGGQRLGGTINATQIGQTAGCAMLIVVLAKYLNDINRLKLIIFSVLPIFVTILAGSRNGLLLISIALLTFVFANLISGLNFEKLLILLVSCIVLYYAADYVLNNTFVGERMLNTDNQAEEIGLQTGTILDVFGDRGVFYNLGWQYFLEHPIFGIGLWNFRYISPWPYPLHTEYMVHLCEGGLIGFALYFSIIVNFVKATINLMKTRRDSASFIMFIFVFSYLFVGLSARLFFTPHFYTLLGPVLASIITIKYKFVSRFKSVYKYEKKSSSIYS